MATDPLAKVLGFGWAAIAVNSFFAISGFLIVRSYLTHDNLRIFLQARILRIMPGLIVAVLVCAYLIGVTHTKLELANYLQDSRVWKFVYTNIGMYNRAPTLPGVFLDNHAHGVNGSLWTLSYEVTMYIGVALLGVTGLLQSRKGLVLICFIYAAYFILVTGHPDIASHWISPHSSKYQRLSLYFFLGGCLYVFKDNISLNILYAIGLWLLALAAYKTSLFQFVFSLAMTYSVFWLALVPRGKILAFNQFDDYSYGIYIYAFPIQQVLIARFSYITETQLFFSAFLATFAMAWLSCKFVEKPALKLNSALTRQFYQQKTQTKIVASQL